MRSGSSSHSRSRPARTSRTRPAFASTCRCFVTAWRVMSVPDVSCAIDFAPLLHRKATNRSRVSSPSAANTGAGLRNPALRSGALTRSDMFLDVLHLFVPAAAVHAEHFEAPRRRNLVEAGFYDGQQRATLRVPKLEHHQRGRLRGIVDTRLRDAWLPAPRQQALGLHTLDPDFEHQMLVARMRDLPMRALPWSEG